jgi:hypothetical protein
MLTISISLDSFLLPRQNPEKCSRFGTLPTSADTVARVFLAFAIIDVVRFRSVDSTPAR